MSFQDVGRNKRPPNRGGFGSAPNSGNRPVVVGGDTVGSSAASGSGGNTGYEQLSDLIVQFQRNVGLLEKMARSIGTPNDTSVLQTQYSLQTEVITTLSTKINTQLSTLESRLSTLPRSEAAPLRSTHVKLSRDYRLVEQRYKNLVLDVKKRRNLRQVRKREEETMTDNGGGNGDGGSLDVRRQMQIQEDRINEEIMKEREEEIRNIHKGMHQVNEIYKDLAHLVDNQQEGIDQIETQMEGAKENTSTGLKHIEKANEHQQSNCVVS